MHQQTAGTQGVLVKNISLFIGADVHPMHVHLTVLGDAEGIFQVHMALTDRLDLGARQLDACLVLILDKIIVVGLAVLGDHLDAPALHGTTSPRHALRLLL